MPVIELPKSHHPDFSTPARKPVGPVEIDWSNRFSQNLVSAHVLNSPHNIVNGGVGSLVGDAIIQAGALHVDGTGDYFVFDAATRESMRFREEDFAIAIKYYRGTQVNSFPAMIANGSTASGEWMFRTILGNGWSFYANPTQLQNVGPGPVAGETGWATVTRTGSDITIYIYDEIGNFRGTGTTTITANMNGVDTTAGLGGADAVSTRLWAGKILASFVWKGRGFTQTQMDALIRDPYQTLKPSTPLQYFVPEAAAVGGAKLQGSLMMMGVGI